MTVPTPPPPPDTGWLSWLTAIKGLTLTNVLVIAALGAVAAPLYLLYRAVNDDELLDRFMSNYRELSNQNVACTIRTAKYRGGSTVWAVSTGFAFIGRDRYILSAVLDHEPTQDEMQSYCETVKLMADSVGDEALKEVQEVRP